LKSNEERAVVETIASRVLSNPVIESYRIEWPQGTCS